MRIAAAVAKRSQPLYNSEVVLASHWRRRGGLLDEVEKSLCRWGASLGQPLHKGEVVLALEDGEEDYLTRLRRACAGG